jgi:hypothetical protein
VEEHHRSSLEDTHHHAGAQGQCNIIEEPKSKKLTADGTWQDDYNELSFGFDLTADGD